jgi:WD40 repeat protein
MFMPSDTPSAPETNLFLMTNTTPELVLVGRGSPVTALAFSTDGKTLVTGSYDQTAIVWDVETGQMRRLLRLRGFVSGLILTPDGTRLVTDDGHVWDMHTGRLLRKARSYIAPLSCSPDGRTLACTTFLPKADGVHVLLADVRTGRTRHRFPCGEHQPESLSFSSDGELVAACGYHSRQEDGETPYITTVFNRRTGEIHHVLADQYVSLFGVNLEPNARLIAVSPNGNQLWNAETGEVLRTVVDAPENSLWLDTNNVCLSPDGNLLAVGSREGDISVWNVATSERLWQAPAHHGWVRSIALTNDGRTLATAGDDHTIGLWDAWNGTRRCILGRRRDSVKAVGFSTDGQAMTAIYEDGTARFWRIAPPMCERQESNRAGLLTKRPDVLTWHARYTPELARNLWSLSTAMVAEDFDFPPEFTIAAISPDGLLLALNRRFSKLCIWNRAEHRVLWTVPDVPDGWSVLTFSADNQLLAVGPSEGDRVRLFDARTGEVRWDVVTHESSAFNFGCSGIAFSPDSQQLAVGHAGFAVTLWSVETSKRQRLLWAQGDSVSTLAFSPNAKILAIGTDYEETVWLRNLTLGRKGVALVGHTDNIRSADFSPNGQVIATGAQDGTVRLWNVRDGKLLATFLALPDDEWIIFTPDGHYTGSPRAEQYLLWKSGDDLLPADAFSNTYRDLEKWPLRDGQ